MAKALVDRIMGDESKTSCGGREKAKRSWIPGLLSCRIMGDESKTSCGGGEKAKRSWIPGWLSCRNVPVAVQQPPPEQKVTLVVTPIGPKLPRKLQAYHTSVLLGSVELSFSIMGISFTRGPQSHAELPRSEETETREMGTVRAVDAATLRRKLVPHFRRDTYDLLRKNCNSFTDACLFALVGVRLDKEYRHLEQAGLSVEKSLGLVRRLTRGSYTPNPQADAFDIEEVVAEFIGMAETRASKLSDHIPEAHEVVVADLA